VEAPLGKMGSMVAEVPDTTEGKIDIIIEEEAEEIIVEYFTEAPILVEENISEYKKRIVISSDVHYLHH